MSDTRFGISGRIARFFQDARITPLLGAFAVLVTPREEEPQIDVTMIDVLIPFPGADVAEVERMVATPAEQVLAGVAGLDHITSVSRPGLALVTVQFEVGVARNDAVVRLHETLQAHRDWLPAQLGVLEPIVKSRGIDDVPIVVLTLSSARPDANAYDLERVAHSIEADIKRVSGTREVATLGGPGRAINVELDPARMRASGVTVADLRTALISANAGAPVGDVVAGNRSLRVEAGDFLRNARELGELLVAVHDGRPVYLADVAELRDGPPPARHYVWRGDGGAAPQESPAVVIAVSKKPGENAVEVAAAVIERVGELHNAVIPADVRVEVSRNYGHTANEKAQQLIEKLMFATALVVALVFFALGRREAVIVGTAVVLTLAATLFASWAWGYTLNRVSLFALIFSIGILVDDAIVVIENIHRHRLLEPDAPLARLIPAAVDEVGGPTILATFTVIAALLPMAFVSGLMGPYMSPIPINASMGMFISLAVAFVVTPWLARRLLGNAHHGVAARGARLDALSQRLFHPFLDDVRGTRRRALLWLVVLGLIVVSLALPVFKLVLLKMLPFDNKSEFQVVVDMPAGTPVERTAAALRAMTRHLATVPEVASYQAYAGLAAPINFNGLVRQYYLRAGGELGDIQVNLVEKSARAEQSHAIAMRMRPALAEIGARYGARVKLVEVPPGPPVLAPIVAEIYGPDEAGRNAVAAQIRAIFAATT